MEELVHLRAGFIDLGGGHQRTGGLGTVENTGTGGRLQIITRSLSLVGHQLPDPLCHPLGRVILVDTAANATQTGILAQDGAIFLGELAGIRAYPGENTEHALVSLPAGAFYRYAVFLLDAVHGPDPAGGREQAIVLCQEAGQAAGLQNGRYRACHSGYRHRKSSQG